MKNETLAGSDLFRLTGLLAIAVGIAWAVQIVGFGPATGLSRLLWVLAAAAISGAGVGMVVVSGQMPESVTAPASA